MVCLEGMYGFIGLYCNVCIYMEYNGSSESYWRLEEYVVKVG